jgi:diaminopimelate decarboxylase
MPPKFMIRPRPRAEQWGLAADRARGLLLEGLSLHRLLERYGSPLHVVHAARLAANVRPLQEIPPRASAGCDIFYSYKTNPVPGVLRFLQERGMGAEVISPYEMWLAERMGVPPSRIVFNGPAKSDEALTRAISRGVLVNLNHREEMAAAARVAERVGRDARVGLRVATKGGWSGQLGLRIEGGEALRGFAEALAQRRLRVVGLHAHFGPPIRSAASLGRFVLELLAFCDLLHERLGLDLELLDLGGGLAIPTVTPLGSRPATLSVRDYVRDIVLRVERHFEAARRKRPRIVLEPGRALTGSAQMLLARVVSVKATSRAHAYAMLDAGTNVAEALHLESHHVLPVNRYREASRRRYTLAGPLCSPSDVLAAGVLLPELRPGDSLAIMDAGAYFVPYQTNFSFPRPAIVMVENGRPRLLRRAERFEDLVAFDQPDAGQV